MKHTDNITQFDAQKIGFHSADDFHCQKEIKTSIYKDELRKLGYATGFRGIPIETQIDRGWIILI